MEAVPDDSLEGKMLIAMPTIGDSRFDRTVIYMCVHNAEGSMGIVVNKPATELTFPKLMEHLELAPEATCAGLGETLHAPPILIGGPVETGRGFVLHTQDYYSDSSTLPVAENIGLTATVDILKAIVEGEGPERSVLALGYAGWGPGQLENELRANGWLYCESDPELVFGTELDDKYNKALHKIGIDLSLLSGDMGQA